MVDVVDVRRGTSFTFLRRWIQVPLLASQSTSSPRADLSDLTGSATGTYLPTTLARWSSRACQRGLAERFYGRQLTGRLSADSEWRGSARPVRVTARLRGPTARAFLALRRRGCRFQWQIWLSERSLEYTRNRVAERRLAAHCWRLLDQRAAGTYVAQGANPANWPGARRAFIER